MMSHRRDSKVGKKEHRRDDSPWTAERSAEVMKQLTRESSEGQAGEKNPSIEKIRDNLVQNACYFMENVKGFLDSFKAAELAMKPPPYIVAMREGLVVKGEAVTEWDTALLSEAELKQAVEDLRRFNPLVRGEKFEVEVEMPKPAVSANAVKKPTADSSSSDEDDDVVVPDGEEIDFPDNALLLVQLQKLRLVAYELITVFDGIQDWVALNVPTMSDENPAIEVMAAVAEQTGTLTDPLRRACDAQLKYLDARSDLENEVTRFPQSVSSRDQFLAFELDTWNDVRARWRSFTRCVTILHTVLARNMKNLTMPEGERVHNAMFM